MVESLASIARLSIASSPEEVRRRIAMALIEKGTSGAPVQHWTQGMDRIAKALIGGMEMRDMEEADKKGLAERGSSLRRMLGGEPTPEPQPVPVGPRPSPVTAGAGLPVDAAQPPFDPDKDATMRAADPLNPRNWSGYQVKDERGNVVGGGALPSAPASPSVATGNTSPPPQQAAQLPPRQRVAQALANQPPPRPAPGLNMPPEVRSEVDRLLAMGTRTSIARAEEIAKPFMQPKDPTYGVIGQDQFGDPVHGWIDPRTQSVRRQALPPGAPEEGGSIPAPPTGADPKLWRQKQTEAAAANVVPGTPDAAAKLRREVQDLPSYKNLAQSAPVYRSMVEAAGRDNRASDVNMIYGMAKLMDPGSVVRESEMTIAQAVATLPEGLRAAVMSQLQGTGRLSPDVRTAIMEEAHSRVQAYQHMFSQDTGMYGGIADRSRINREDVIPSFGQFERFQASGGQATAPMPGGRGIPSESVGGGAGAPSGVEPGDYIYVPGRGLIRRGQ